MELYFVKAIASIILPPTGLVVLAMVGVGIAMIWKKLGLWMAFLSMLGVLLCSMPAVSAILVNSLQSNPAIPASDVKKSLAQADALVVLAGGRRGFAEEFGDDTVSSYTLERIRYAAWVVKRTGLPLIVSGGRVHDEAKSEGQLMREILQKEFIVIVDHVEEKSRTTYENAKYTAQFLKQNDLRKIALITHAAHMPRAKAAFEYFDIEVIPAPTAFYGKDTTQQFSDYLPSTNALRQTGLAVHEIFGQWWYEIRYY